MDSSADDGRGQQERKGRWSGGMMLSVHDVLPAGLEREVSGQSFESSALIFAWEDCRRRGFDAGRVQRRTGLIGLPIEVLRYAIIAPYLQGTNGGAFRVVSRRSTCLACSCATFQQIPSSADAPKSSSLAHQLCCACGHMPVESHPQRSNRNSVTALGPSQVDENNAKKLADALDVSSLSFFSRHTAAEFLRFASRLVAERLCAVKEHDLDQRTHGGQKVFVRVTLPVDSTGGALYCCIASGLCSVLALTNAGLADGFPFELLAQACDAVPVELLLCTDKAGDNVAVDQTDLLCRRLAAAAAAAAAANDRGVWNDSDEEPPYLSFEEMTLEELLNRGESLEDLVARLPDDLSAQAQPFLTHRPRPWITCTLV